MNLKHFFQRMIAVLILWVAVTMTAGCATLVERQLIDPPKVTFEGMSLEYNSFFELTPIFYFKVVNPNPMSLKIRNIEYSFEINDKKFIKGVADKGIRLKTIGSEVVGLSLTFNTPNLFGSFTEFIRTDNIRYMLSGSVRVGPFAVPYSAKGELDLPKLPEISLKQVDIPNFSLTEKSAVIFSLSLENPNPFSVHLDGLNYDIKLGGKAIARGIARSVVIEKGSISTLELPVSISFAELDWSMDNVFMASSSDYELSGEITFDISGGSESFSFQTNGKVPIHK
ncbi:LEA type 2 family protein [Desulfococcaceae bacterium HSG8]|nr:LEA type 2 family protein [Desulfococcaceae bacterium HSG8]